MSSGAQSPPEITRVMNPDADALAELDTRIDQLGSDEKPRIEKTLREISDAMKGAIDIWADYLEASGSDESSNDTYTAVMWIGPERAKNLHRHHLSLRQHARELSDATAIAFKDTIGISMQIDIVEAYDLLKPDETGSMRATEAIKTIEQRQTRIGQTLGLLRAY